MSLQNPKKQGKYERNELNYCILASKGPKFKSLIPNIGPSALKSSCSLISDHLHSFYILKLQFHSSLHLV